MNLHLLSKTEIARFASYVILILIASCIVSVLLTNCLLSPQNATFPSLKQSTFALQHSPQDLTISYHNKAFVGNLAHTIDRTDSTIALLFLPAEVGNDLARKESVLIWSQFAMMRRFVVQHRHLPELMVVIIPKSLICNYAIERTNKIAVLIIHSQSDSLNTFVENQELSLNSSGPNRFVSHAGFKDNYSRSAKLNP